MIRMRCAGVTIKSYGQDELKFRYRFKSPTSAELHNEDHANRIEMHRREVERLLGSAEDAQHVSAVS